MKATFTLLAAALILASAAVFAKTPDQRVIYNSKGQFTAVVPAAQTAAASADEVPSSCCGGGSAKAAVSPTCCDAEMTSHAKHAKAGAESKPKAGGDAMACH
jgi:Na+-transporting NADH:ubiquinone oxidoreductase subunit NqrF